MNHLDNALIGARVRMAKCKETIKDFFTSEMGVSNVVATIILLLIVVLLIAVFWDQLSAWMADIMSQIFDPDNTPKPEDIQPR